MKIYLDQQMIENLRTTRSVKNYTPEELTDFRTLYLVENKKGNIETYYSMIHIFECVKRNDPDTELLEIDFLKGITNNRFIDDKLNSVEQDPLILYNSVKNDKLQLINYQFMNFITGFQLEVLSQFNLREFGFDNSKLNNVKKENISAEINKLLKRLSPDNGHFISAQERAVKYIKSQKGSYIENVSEFASKLFENIFNGDEVDLIGNLTKSAIDIMKIQIVELYSKIPDVMIESIRNQKTENYELEAIFHTVEQSSEISSGVKIAILEAFNYKPDNKSNKKKNPMEQQFDSIHYGLSSQCDVFLTEDKKLLDKADVVNHFSMDGSKVWSIKDFLKCYKSGD